MSPRNYYVVATLPSLKSKCDTGFWTKSGEIFFRSKRRLSNCVTSSNTRAIARVVCFHDEIVLCNGLGPLVHRQNPVGPLDGQQELMFQRIEYDVKLPRCPLMHRDRTSTGLRECLKWSRYASIRIEKPNQIKS